MLSLDYGGTFDAFVSLLSADLKQLVQSTYLGGTNYDYAYFRGRFRGECLCGGEYQFNNFPGTSGGAQPAYGGGNSDAFVSRLSADLKQLVQSTYLGGTGDDHAYSLAVSGGMSMWRGIPIQPIFPVPAEVLSLDMVEEI